MKNADGIASLQNNFYLIDVDSGSDITYDKYFNILYAAAVADDIQFQPNYNKWKSFSMTLLAKNYE